MTAGTLTTTLLSRIGEAGNRTLVLPLVAFFPTSRCNSQCQSCAWWQSSGSDDLSLGEIAGLVDTFSTLGTRLVVFSGGEPLLRPDVFDIARLFRSRGIALHLLTSGLGLASRATEVAQHFERVIVSLDATSAPLYAQIRGVDGLGAVTAGVARLTTIAPQLPVTARATLHGLNFRELPHLIDGARGIGFTGISFLAADVTSGAFGRDGGSGPKDLLLTTDEVAEFRTIVDEGLITHAEDLESGFVSDRPEAIQRLPQYYAAMLGEAPFPRVSCNAPWVSAVVEGNGDVRPCFFHEPIGNVRRQPLDTIVRRHLREFRATLDVATNRTCTHCVCSLKTGWRNQPWR